MDRDPTVARPRSSAAIPPLSELSPEQWARVKDVFHAAVERPPAERRAFVHAAGGDPAVASAVERLLAGDEAAQSFMETPAAALVGALAPPAAAALTVGQPLGAYRIVASLGAGGMGEVYRAHDSKLGRDVAVKVLPTSLASHPDRLARFDREARVLATLNHPNIAIIHGIEDAPDDSGRDFRAIVMELIDGETLAQRLQRGPIPLADALAIARQIADALDAAHEKGIIHRDLKPANIATTRDGVVKVLDFGLAKAASGDGAIADLTQSPTVFGGTQEGVILGTAAYMSPEQARARPADKRTDIWAFGCVLYEMLTGRVAFAGETVSDIVARILEREPDWGLLPALTPHAILALLRRCLEKDPKRRLRDIGDVHLLIEDMDAGARDGVASASNGPSAARRLTAFASLGGALVVSAGLIATLLPKWLSPSPGAVATGTAMPLTNFGERETSGAIHPNGSSFVFVSSHGGTPDIWLRQIAGGQPVPLTDTEAEEMDLVYAPDGEHIYYATGGAGIWRVGALGGESRKVVTGGLLPAPSPDKKSLAYYETSGEGWVLVVSALDGSQKRELVRNLASGRRNPRPAWSADGRWIAYCRSNSFSPINLFVVEVATGDTRQVTHFTRSLEGVLASAWLPDNRHLLVTYAPSSSWQQPSELGILDVLDGSITRLTISIRDSFAEPSVSQDGSRAVVTSGYSRRELWKVPLDSTDAATNGRNAVPLLDDSTWDPMWTFLSRDGRTVLFNSPASGVRNLWTMPAAGDERPRQITALSESAISHSSQSPDGQRVAFASNVTGISKIWTQNVDGSGLRQLTDGEGTDSWPVWSPDGQWIAYNTTDGNRNETWRIPSHGGIPEKLFDVFFRGDWARQPGEKNMGTWIVTSGPPLMLFDVERRTRIQIDPIGGSGWALPVFSSDSRKISVVARRNNGKEDSLWILDAVTGEKRLAAILPFHVLFRAGWAADSRSVIVTRDEPTSHIVMFERFWDAR